MSRVIHTDSPGKRRNQLMRTGAELLRRLSQKQTIDDETKDMLALLIFSLRDIADGIEESTLAWEKRNYWIKVEEFRNNWRWAGEMTAELENMVLNGEWHNLPALMVKLFPYYSDIKIIKFTRKSALWQGCYNALIQDQP
jgi:hypothetical protein